MEPVKIDDQVRVGWSGFADVPNARVIGIHTLDGSDEIGDVRTIALAPPATAFWQKATAVFRIGSNGEVIDANGNERCFDCLSWGPCKPYCSMYVGEPATVRCCGELDEVIADSRCAADATHSELGEAKSDIPIPMCDGCCGEFCCARKPKDPAAEGAAQVMRSRLPVLAI